MAENGKILGKNDSVAKASPKAVGPQSQKPVVQGGQPKTASESSKTASGSN